MRAAFRLSASLFRGYIARMSNDAFPPGGTPPPDWDGIARDPDFRRLLVDKAKFLAPATAFFLVYYFALPVLVGFAPEFMETPILGVVNIAYLFALSQFFMAWILAALYVRAAMRWDRESDAILKKFGQE